MQSRYFWKYCNLFFVKFYPIMLYQEILWFILENSFEISVKKILVLDLFSAVSIRWRKMLKNIFLPRNQGKSIFDFISFY